MLQLPLNIHLEDFATFDNFYFENNQQLFLTLKNIDFFASNFFYIWGKKSTGKTHLAQALCHQANHNNLQAAYLPLDNIDLTPEILNGMSFMDIVCLDNLEAVTGKSNWEVAIFNLYNELKSKHKSLVVFGDLPPKSLSVRLPDLLSRFFAMEVYQLFSLQDEQKVKLFLQRAKNRGMIISEDVIQFIISRYSRSVGELMQVLEKLDSSSLSLKRKITIPLVKQILEI